MAEAVLSILNQSILVDGVSDVVMTPIVPGEEGGFVREFRVFGPRPNPGGNGPLVYVLRVAGTTEEALELTTPQLQV